MKSFSDYLMESKKKYNFSIKLAFKPDSALLDKIESALGRFDLDSFGKVQSLPIKKTDRNFPKLVNPEIYQMQIVLNYPASNEFVKNALIQVGILDETVAVVSTDHEASVDAEDTGIESNTSDEVLLDKDINSGPKTADQKDLMGDDYNKKLVKNSVTGKVKIKNGPPAAKFNTDEKEGVKSPIGTTRNKIPHVTSSFKK